MSDEKKRFVSASNSSLPIASAIDDADTFRRAVSLLQQQTELIAQISECDEKLSAIKEELAAICEAFSLKGVRYGLSGFEYHGWQTRKTLSKQALLAAGVPAKTIEEAYVDSKPYMSTKTVVFDIP